MFTGKTPDITPAQVAALVGWIVTQAVAFGYLDGRFEQLAVSIGATFLFAAWKLADAYLRGSRAKAHIPPVPVATVTPPA